MLSREQAVGARTPANKYGLVVPVIVHDGESIPPNLGLIQMLDIKEYYNPRMRRDSEKAEVLSDIIGTHAPGLARAIENAPTWQASWPAAAARQLYNAYFSQATTQTRLPRFRN